MADRILHQVLGKYLQLFIKNYSRETMQVSILKGTGTMNNVVLNEDCIQEFLPLSFLRGMLVGVPLADY
jgi:N-terminal region of Chorein or VPS13